VNFRERDLFDGMFSFVPTDAEKAFKRPRLEGDLISDNLKQGIKITETDEPEVVWKNVVDRVTEAGLSLMTNAQEPQLARDAIAKTWQR
jgi:hypothetical protein